MQEKSNDSHQSTDRGEAAQRPSTAAMGATPSNTAPGNSDSGGSEGSALVTQW